MKQRRLTIPSGTAQQPHLNHPVSLMPEQRQQDDDRNGNAE
jgi:hypothetical protein